MTIDGFIKLKETQKKIARKCGCNSFMEMRLLMLMWREGGKDFEYYAKELGFSTSTPSKAGLKKVIEMLVRNGEVKNNALTRKGVLKAGSIHRTVANIGEILNSY